ncbi:hypothetical protein B0I37DRAFT_242330 [Chaetomium sp. MPI-CAGE-AT-0009]|nr:hypothetical protein B0I37DRAFT_242330 [Chaetomium sp. MPI-CAGE-AT-0009]
MALGFVVLLAALTSKDGHGGLVGRCHGDFLSKRGLHRGHAPTLNCPEPAPSRLLCLCAKIPYKMRIVDGHPRRGTCGLGLGARVQSARVEL